MTYLPVSVHPSALHFWIISYSFHRIALKPGGQLDHEVRRILFLGYGTPNFDGVITLFKDFFFRQHFVSG